MTGEFKQNRNGDTTLFGVDQRSPNLTTEKKTKRNVAGSSLDEYQSSDLDRSPLIEEEVVIEPHLTESYADDEYGTHTETDEQTKQVFSKSSKE